MRRPFPIAYRCCYSTLIMFIESAHARFAPVKKSKTFNRILDALDLRTKKVLDIGCGFGEYLVEFGEGSLGLTTAKEEAEYGTRHGIRIVSGNAELIDSLGLDETFEAIWSNNLFEHLLSPHAYLMKLRMVADTSTMLVLGVPVIPRIPSLMRVRKFRGALADAHVNFFTRESLMRTVERAGWTVRDTRPFVVRNAALDRLLGFFMPHVYVIAYNDPDFKYSDKKLREWKDDGLYAAMLGITGQGKG